MATKKDLVEAYSFSRRRLVTAFVSGAPGGREVEPARPGRTIVGGLALAVLLVAGAAIASVLASRTPEDWNKVGLVVTRGDQPATYVILEESEPPELLPVINITSAQLILGADVKPTSVDQDVIDEQTPGDPDRHPRCAADAAAAQAVHRERLDRVHRRPGRDRGRRVQRAEGASARRAKAIVVKSADGYWLIATSSSREDRRSAAPTATRSRDDEGDQLLVDYDLGQPAEAINVPPDWLALFPEGGEIGPDGFDVPRLGKPAADSPVPGARGRRLRRAGRPGRRWSSTAAGSRSTRSRWRCSRTRPSSTGRTSSTSSCRRAYLRVDATSTRTGRTPRWSRSTRRRARSWTWRAGRVPHVVAGGRPDRRRGLSRAGQPRARSPPTTAA